MVDIIPLKQVPALADDASVKEFSQVILHLSSGFQEALRRISEQDESFPSDGYGLLTEAYGLRARANILYLTPSMHVVQEVGFSQVSMLDEFNAVLGFLKSTSDFNKMNSMLISVITFASALGAGRARVLDFLFETLRADIKLLSH